MKKKFAVVRDNVVVNVIVLENAQDWPGDDELIEVTPENQIGMSWSRDVDGFWMPPKVLETEEPELSQDKKDAANLLTPVQFTHMLALNGDPAWEDVWAAVEAYLKERNRAAYADLRAQTKSGRYSLKATLAFVADMKAITDQLFPDADLSEATIRNAWEAAKG